MVLRSAALVGVLLVLAAASAHAATIDVTTIQDVVANDGSCSLREAVAAANTDTASGTASGECPAGTPGGNQIVLGAGRYELTGGELRVTSSLVLSGQSTAVTTITTGGLGRVLEVTPSGVLTLRDLSVVGGHAPDGAAATGTVAGTAGGSGGGILNAGSLGLDGVDVSGNSAGNGGPGIAGSAPGDGAGPGGDGGGIESTGPSLTLSGSTVAQNVAGNGGSGPPRPNVTCCGGDGGAGGGIDVHGGFVTINDSTIAGNRSGEGGLGATVGGQIGDGGGMALDPRYAQLVDDTVVNNATPPPMQYLATPVGGALVQTGGVVNMIHMTIALNVIPGAAAPGFPVGYADIASDGGMTIWDSALQASCSPGILDGGYNVALIQGGCPGLPACPGGYPPAECPGAPMFLLGPLQANGGPTETMLPEPESALIDEVPGNQGGCQPNTDQRGVVRAQGAACDAGSVEVRPFTVEVRPARLRFGRLRVGHIRRKAVRVTYTSGERSTVSLGRVRLTGRGARDFHLEAIRCRGKSVSLSKSCTVVISFRPRQRGVRTAKVTLAGLRKTVSVTGTGLT